MNILKTSATTLLLGLSAAALLASTSARAADTDAKARQIVIEAKADVAAEPAVTTEDPVTIVSEAAPDDASADRSRRNGRSPGRNRRRRCSWPER